MTYLFISHDLQLFTKNLQLNIDKSTYQYLYYVHNLFNAQLLKIKYLNDEKE